jgi:transposase-like protein
VSTNFLVDTFMGSSYPIRRRRQHAPEFKRGLVALCRPGVSISAVALAHGVNANLLRRWINQCRNELVAAPVASQPSKLVAVQVDLPAQVPPGDDAIEIGIEKNNARISIRWPGNQAQAFGLWLGAWLK